MAWDPNRLCSGFKVFYMFSPNALGYNLIENPGLQFGHQVRTLLV